MRVQIDDGCFAPERAHRQDAGLDIKSPVCVVIPSGGSAVIDTGVHVEIPFGYTGFLKSKSGLNVKHGITSEGVIDSGYNGAIICKLYNSGEREYIVRRGDKITQLVVLPVLLDGIEVVDEINGFERGAAGFGSTGR